MQLITIKTFEQPVEAHLYLNILETEGMDAVLFDEHTVGLNPLYNLTLGGIKLKVREEDVERALQIINEAENRPLLNEEEQEVFCPECQSQDIMLGYRSMKKGRWIWSGLVSIFLGVLPPFGKKVNRCKACGNEFEMNQ